MPSKKKGKSGKGAPPATPAAPQPEKPSFQNADGTWRNPYPHPPHLWESPAHRLHREVCAERDEARQEEASQRAAHKKASTLPSSRYFSKHLNIVGVSEEEQSQER